MFFARHSFTLRIPKGHFFHLSSRTRSRCLRTAVRDRGTIENPTTITGITPQQNSLSSSTALMVPSLTDLCSLIADHSPFLPDFKLNSLHVRPAPFRPLPRRRGDSRHHARPRHLLRPRPFPRRRPPRRLSLLLRHVPRRAHPRLRRRRRHFRDPGRVRRGLS